MGTFAATIDETSAFQVADELPYFAWHFLLIDFLLAETRFSLFQQLLDVRAVKFWFEEERIVAFVGVDGDVHGVHIRVVEMGHEFVLLFWVKAEIAVDRED